MIPLYNFFQLQKVHKESMFPIVLCVEKHNEILLLLCIFLFDKKIQ